MVLGQPCPAHVAWAQPAVSKKRPLRPRAGRESRAVAEVPRGLPSSVPGHGEQAPTSSTSAMGPAAQRGSRGLCLPSVLPVVSPASGSALTGSWRPAGWRGADGPSSQPRDGRDQRDQQNGWWAHKQVQPWPETRQTGPSLPCPAAEPASH